MHRGLLLVGGVLNTLLALFPVFLSRQIHLLAGLNPGQQALMEMLNAGGTLMIVFFAAASFACASDLLGTRLGEVALGFVSLLYLSVPRRRGDRDCTAILRRDLRRVRRHRADLSRSADRTAQAPTAADGR